MKYLATSSTADVITSTPSARPKALENAVYGHIRAVRALGRTQINASEIAAALSVPLSDVITAIAALRNKGVKIAE